MKTVMMLRLMRKGCDADREEDGGEDEVQAMGTRCGSSRLLLLSREHDGSEDGYKDEDGGDLEGEEQLGEEERADLGDVADGVVEVAAEVCGAEGLALREEDEAEQAEDGCGAGEADDVGGTAAVWFVLLRRR